MFARIVECQSKAGRSEQIGNKLKNDVLPILQRQPGFVDFLTLRDKTNPKRLLCISFWTSREDTEEYHRQHYDKITDMLKPGLESPPTLETFAVNASTRIAVRSAEQLERTARIVPARVIRLRAGSLELPGRYILAKNLRLFILARCGQSARVRSTLKGQSYDKLRVHVE